MGSFHSKGRRALFEMWHQYHGIFKAMEMSTPLYSSMDSFIHLHHSNHQIKHHTGEAPPQPHQRQHAAWTLNDSEIQERYSKLRVAAHVLQHDFRADVPSQPTHKGISPQEKDAYTKHHLHHNQDLHRRHGSTLHIPHGWGRDAQTRPSDE